VDDEIRILDALVADGAVAAERRPEVIAALTRAPDRAAWGTFVHHFGLALGTASILAGIVYLVAFNWAALGFLTKLGVASAVVLACATLAAVRGPRTLVGRLAAVGGAVTSGAGLVIYSQHWQTGADPWTLFAGWAVFALPFALAARTPAAWAVVVALVDTAAIAAAIDVSEEGAALVTTALGVAHLALAPAFAGTWLAPVLRFTAALALVLMASPFAIDRQWWGGPAYGLVLVGFLAAQAAFLVERAAVPLATLAWVAAVALATVELVSRLVDANAQLVGLTTVPGLFVLGSTVIGFAWLIGVPRMHARAGGAS
jgi:hypothetical protein